MEAKIQNKHLEKQKLKKKIQTTLKRGLNLIIVNTAFHQLNLALKSKFKVVTSQHQKKLSNSRTQQNLKLRSRKPTILKILYRICLHINYQQLNTLHYRTDLTTIISLVNLIAMEHILSLNSVTKKFCRTYHMYQKTVYIIFINEISKFL